MLAVVAVTASAGGSVVLLVVGIGFLIAGAVGWMRWSKSDGTQPWLGVAIDVIVGCVASVDAAMGIIDAPGRATLWSTGSAALVVAVVLIIEHHHRPGPASSGSSRAGSGSPAPGLAGRAVVARPARL